MHTLVYQGEEYVKRGGIWYDQTYCMVPTFLVNTLDMACKKYGVETRRNKGNNFKLSTSDLAFYRSNNVITNPRLDKLPRIDMFDFVVRSNVFKCNHDKHKLRDIDVAIDLINRKGQIVRKRVPAGYCATCDVYFIMESTFENLKKQGTLLCRLSNEKNYRNKNYRRNDMILADESVLMMYGYNVSQAEGLSELQRRKILALLIDRKVLTRSVIISYLDFFIKQRQYTDKYMIAISKWESDRKFICEYHDHFYRKYGTGGLNI